MLVNYTRGAGGMGLKLAEVRALHATLQDEAQRCAEAAGDEDELWRLRIASLFCHSYIDYVSVEEIAQQREIALQAEAYFRKKGDWAAVSEAIDGYAALSQIIGAYDDVLTASQRRLDAPDLPALERGDALQMIAKAYYCLGDYEACIATIQNTLEPIRRGHPLLHLGSGISHAVVAAYISGRWSDILTLRPKIEELWEQVQHDTSVRYCLDTGYMTILEMALAQEDRATIDAAASIFMRIFPDASSLCHSFISILLADDPTRINDLPLERISEEKHTALLFVPFCNERGVPIPQTLLNMLEGEKWYANDQKRYLAIAQAIITHDDERLAREIDEAEAQQMVVHAARMRIVLAQHTHDCSQLERARPVLERLNDRYFLCRLKEVRSALTIHAA
jgi:hypothetical protein